MIAGGNLPDSGSSKSRQNNYLELASLQIPVQWVCELSEKESSPFFCLYAALIMVVTTKAVGWCDLFMDGLTSR